MSLITCPPYSVALIAALIEAGYDPYFNNVSLLMHMEGANNGTTFTDQIGHSNTQQGAPVTSTAQSKFGTASAYFNGTSGITISSSPLAEFQFGTGDFTQEAWIFPTVTFPVNVIISNGAASGNTGLVMYINASNFLVCSSGGTQVVNSNVAVSLNVWSHVAVTRRSGTVELWINGALVGTAANSFNCTDGVCYVGGQGTNRFNGYIDEARVTKGIARYVTAFSVPTAPFPDSLPNLDRFYDSNALVMHFDGANNSTSFPDQMGHNFAIQQGTPKISTAQSKFGGSSLLLNGETSSAILRCPASTDFDVTPGNFTMEAWVYVTAYNPNASQGMNICSNFTGGSGWAWTLGGINTFTTFFFQTWNAGVAVDTAASSSIAAAMTLNAWHHVAICKSGSTYYFFVDGVAHGTAAAGASVPAGGTFALGVYQQNLTYPSWFRGYIDNLRINKGFARYTASFTPSAQAIPNSFSDNTYDPYLDQTTLMLHMDGTHGSSTIVDTKGNTVTPTGVTLSNVSPRHGATSGAFPGNGYLTIPNSSLLQFQTGDFTIEYWINITSFPTAGAHMGMRPGSGGDGWLIYTTSSTLAFYSANSTVINIAVTWPLLQWNHIAITRYGNLFSFWLNGVLITSVTNALTFNTSASALVIGRNAANGLDHINGYMDEIRITKGVARYRSAFTPVSAKFPDAKVDSLNTFDPYAKNVTALLRFEGSNGSTTFTDDVGNTYGRNGTSAISTVKSKFGTASLLNPGNGCDVTSPSLVGLTFGAADFTVECWVNYTAIGSTNSAGIFQMSTAAGGIQASTSNSLAVGSTSVTGRWEMYAANVATYSPVIPATNTWYHVALVRLAGVTTLYVNGVALMSVADTTNYTGTYLAIGGYYGAVHCMNGYIDDFRVTKGVARYLGNFTPPAFTAPSLSVSEYSIRNSTDSFAANVTCHLSFDTSVITDTTHKNVVTNTLVVPTTQTYVEGGAGLFLGSTTKLNMPAGANFAPGLTDFTVEAWVWVTAASVYNTDATNHVSAIWSQTTTGVNYFVMALVSTSATADPTLRCLTSAGNANGPALNAGAWNHVAVVRRNGVFTCYTNGVPGTPITMATDLTNTSYLPTIGQYSHNSSQLMFAGLLDNIRYTKGAARYNGAFTPLLK